jgi:hypothetical protein
MTRLASIRLCLLAAALFALAAACGRTTLGGLCPAGYDVDGGTCQCLTDEGCPAGYVCNGGTCDCRSDSCCPAGYQFSLDSNACVCHASACCPSEYTWNAAQQMCSCGSQACCPGGYAFDTIAQGCRCAADFCCPVGFAYDSDAGADYCVCQADSCCPANYIFDSTRNVCVCAENSCCPANYTYNASVRACVCSGDACCPAGFVQDPTSQRCICDVTNPNACGNPANNFCSATSGQCMCLNDNGCPAGDYCNSLGFCQSAASCTTNLDCPAGDFCNVSTNTCVAIVQGACATNADCNYIQPSPIPGFAEVCQSGTCIPGCYANSDCPIQPPSPTQPSSSCVGANLGVTPPVLGSCQPYCLINDSCPVNSYCNASNGTCSYNPGNTNCGTCGSSADCGANSTCLSFIVEGQTASFCGSTCNTDNDCPSGFSCGGVIYECSGPGDISCQPPANVVCTLFNPVNEPQTFFCAGPNGQPYVYFNACAPLSGTCPADPYP